MNTLSFTMWCYQFCGNHWLLCLLLWGAEKPPLWVMWLCKCGKRKRGGKNQTKLPPSPAFLFSDSTLGMGISTLHILADCGYCGCLWCLLHHYLLKRFKSANPRVNHPWLVLRLWNLKLCDLLPFLLGLCYFGENQGWPKCIVAPKSPILSETESLQLPAKPAVPSPVYSSFYSIRQHMRVCLLLSTMRTWWPCVRGTRLQTLLSACPL